MDNMSMRNLVLAGSRQTFGGFKPDESSNGGWKAPDGSCFHVDEHGNLVKTDKDGKQTTYGPDAKPTDVFSDPKAAARKTAYEVPTDFKEDDASTSGWVDPDFADRMFWYDGHEAEGLGASKLPLVTEGADGKFYVDWSEGFDSNEKSFDSADEAFDFARKICNSTK